MKSALRFAGVAAVSVTVAACGMFGDEDRSTRTSQSSPATSSGSTAAAPSGETSRMSGTAGMASERGSSSMSASQDQMSRSPDTVRQVQTQLQQQGYDVGPVDGIYGDHTRQAVSQFQRDRGMSASGRLDDQTLAALNVRGGQQTGEAPMSGSDMQSRDSMSGSDMQNRDSMSGSDMQSREPTTTTGEPARGDTPAEDSSTTTAPSR